MLEDEFVRTNETVYLVINWSKSNTMVFSKECTECKMKVEGVRLKQVRETVYLGVRLSWNGGMESQLEWRIGMAATASRGTESAIFWEQRVK